MEYIRRLFAQNRDIVADISKHDPEFFSKRAGKQEPHFLFIGCADSRVPIETLTGVAPGEMFVHRNIANQVRSVDLNLLSVLQYAVEVLDVEHVIVCGHYGCGGVKAAMGDQSYGLVDHWLAGIRDTCVRHEKELARLGDDERRFERMVDLNVLRQVHNLARTPIVQSAWKRGRRPMLHGIVYDIHDGLLKELVMQVDGNDRASELLTTQRGSVGD
ncbi:MAG: carbonic anhydrase [Planctomycetes bacterium]|nr:carbonic anhydrase [Planctomycetota bacterium]